MPMKPETVTIGPIRIPKTYKDALTTLLRDHITYSDLIREAIYQFLKGKGLIKDD